ncbi:MAG: hypothetical protein V4687_07555 [Bacteroidota bacterium]
MKTRFFKHTLCLAVLSGLAISNQVQAQKVTELQEVSIFAPQLTKADGKNNEWDAAAFSVNKRTSISYLISNDDKNLYLAVKSTDVANNSKIMAGGITFSVNPDGKKKEKESITLTYPLINRAQFRRGQGGPGGQGGERRIVMGGPAGGGMGGFGGGNTLTAKQRDSMMAGMQKTQLAQVKEIKIKGFKKTTDTLVSIYNEQGIKAAASIDKDNVFFYEAAIPLEELGMTVNDAKEFAYNVKLNGLQIPGMDFGGGGGNFGGGGGGGGGGGQVRVEMRGGGGGGGNFGGGGRGGMDFQALISPTDFWGKYTLTKK